jgi:hypothetical protein
MLGFQGWLLTINLNYRYQKKSEKKPLVLANQRLLLLVPNSRIKPGATIEQGFRELEKFKADGGCNLHQLLTSSLQPGEANGVTAL